jgi:hypothetical protein
MREGGFAGMSLLDLCAYLGLAAVGTSCANMLLGLLIACATVRSGYGRIADSTSSVCTTGQHMLFS